MNPGPPSVQTLLLIAAGGAIGSVCRALLSWALPAGALPWGTVVANVAGCFLIGALVAWLGDPQHQAPVAPALLITGFCGGFTTFSTFSWQALAALTRGQVGAALGNIAFSLVACLAATWVGWRLFRG